MPISRDIALKPSSVWIWNHWSFFSNPCSLFPLGAAHVGSISFSLPGARRVPLVLWLMATVFYLVFPQAQRPRLLIQGVCFSPSHIVQSLWVVTISYQHLVEFLEHSNYSINILGIEEQMSKYIHTRPVKDEIVSFCLGKQVFTYLGPPASYILRGWRPST